MAEPIEAPRVGGCYLIRLCSGELRCWRFEGREPHGLGWWRDEETGLSFSEASLMYAWQIEGRADGRAPDGGGSEASGSAGHVPEAVPPAAGACDG